MNCPSDKDTLSTGRILAGEDNWFFEQAFEALARDDLEEAQTLISGLAEKGHPEAQYYMGVFFSEGIGWVSGFIFNVEVV